jgi:hypothetical protein
MGNISLILLVAAFLLTLGAAFWRGGPGPYIWNRPHIGWLGVSFYFLSLLLR